MLRRNPSNRRGAEAIEFAFILPIYVMLVLGIVEYGRAFQVLQWLTEAAREGGRLAMLYNVISQADRDLGITSGNNKVEIDIKNFLKAAGVSSGVTVKITDLAGGAFNIDDYSKSARQYFKVRVEVPYGNVKLINPISMTIMNVTIVGITDDTILAGEIILRHE